MYDFIKLNYNELNPDSKHAYEEMAGARLLGNLRHPEDKMNVCIGIAKEGKPVGLALGKVYLQKTLFRDSNRNRFVLEGLVETVFWPKKLTVIDIDDVIGFIEKEFKAKHAFLLYYFTLSKANPHFASIDKVLKERSWQGPLLSLTKYGLTAKFNPPWLAKAKALPLPDGFTLFPWTELTPKEKETLIELGKKQGYSQIVNPFQASGGPLDPRTSLGLRYHNEVVGWIVTHLLKPDLIRFSSLFVQPRYQAVKGIAIKLLAESITLAKESHIPKGLFEVSQKDIKTSWSHFVEQKLKPYADSVEEIVGYWKKL